MVLGPGETAYYAQALAYPLFGLQLPCLVPRPSLTILELRLGYLARYQIDETAFWRS